MLSFWETFGGAVATAVVGGVAWLATRHPRVFLDHIQMPIFIVTTVVLTVFGIGNSGLQCGMHIMAPDLGEPGHDAAQAMINRYLLNGVIVTASLIAVLVYVQVLAWLARKIIDDQERAQAGRRKGK
jgi:hypothetical protein